MTQEVIHQMLQGKNKILLFRKLGDTSAEGARLAFQKEHTFSYNRNLERIETKDGSVIKVGGLESEVPLTAIQSKKDPLFSILQAGAIAGDKFELWEVTVDEDVKTAEGKYPAVYAQGYLESWELPANVEDEAEISTTLQVELEPQFGFTSLSESQELAVQYAFIEVDEQPKQIGDNEG